jgi:hypothetical protein
MPHLHPIAQDGLLLGELPIIADAGSEPRLHKQLIINLIYA